MVLDAGGLILTILPAMSLVAPTIHGNSTRWPCCLATMGNLIKHQKILPFCFFCVLIPIVLLDQLH